MLLVGDMSYYERFGFAPLFLRFVDVWDAVDKLRTIMVDKQWERAEFHVKAAVT